MPRAKSVFLDFVRQVVNGDIDEVSRRLAGNPALATAPAGAGATRQDASTFFFTEIAHYLYAGDTALHMAARRGNVTVAKALLECGADPRIGDIAGVTPLQRAINCRKAEAAALLSASPGRPGSV